MSGEAASAFFAMGGYAVYIWPAYGLALALFILLGLSSYRQVKAAEKKLAGLQRQGDHDA